MTIGLRRDSKNPNHVRLNLSEWLGKVTKL